ncbi:glycoside hydrolase family 15 protein [Pleomorphomonas sp. PLEO]|uniref:glycoside hydrolase family 15 protein n=1 Tax=Pleomorphomonas sp. PLEO TaxID=3239306 RepID=UPI00351F1436
MASTDLGDGATPRGHAPASNVRHTTWASARKDIVGNALGSSRLWFTVAEGIVSEVYYPRIDIPQVKDLGFIISDDNGFHVELRKPAHYSASLPDPGVPAIEIVHSHARFTFTLRVAPSQRRDVLMLQYRLEGDPSLKPYALLQARLGGDSENNIAGAGTYGGRKVLWAEQGPFGLALLAVTDDAADSWQRTSVGSSELSDGWTDFQMNGRMTWEYATAGPGAVVLMGELPPSGTLALGFGSSKEAAATLAISNLLEDFSNVWDEQVSVWKSWLGDSHRLVLRPDIDRALALSATMLKVHQDRTFCGAAVASLSVPWGDASESRGGYHLVWSRDLVETAGALVAFGSYGDAQDILRYLIATQQEDGHWFQNQWIGGSAFWQGVQLDEAGLPILLVAALKEHGELDGISVSDMVMRAASFVARTGPASDQDRWEEDSGVNLFTLAVAIAALVEASAFLPENAKVFALKLADYWNARIEDWTYVEGTAIAEESGATGYYIRTLPLGAPTHRDALAAPLAIKNLAIDPNLPANAQIATDFLQLVRFGLRDPHDPHILESLKVVDAVLKTDTPSGPVWHRYNSDGYGEHEDGQAFDGVGHGRGWPLLTGERGHYALAAGEDVLPYIDAIIAMSSPLGLIPEQIWDTAAIPAYGLEPGRPSGSAMPLVWAHAEFVKLVYSWVLGRPVDRPLATSSRYGGKRPAIDYTIWGPNLRGHHITAGHRLTIALTAPALVHWGINGWTNIADTTTVDTGLGLYVVDLPVAELVEGNTIEFTLFWLEQQTWEGQDHRIEVVPAR